MKSCLCGQLLLTGILGNVGQCGAMWGNVLQCWPMMPRAAMWGDVEQWCPVLQCGAMVPVAAIWSNGAWCCNVGQ